MNPQKTEYTRKTLNDPYVQHDQPECDDKNYIAITSIIIDYY